VREQFEEVIVGGQAGDHVIVDVVEHVERGDDEQFDRHVDRHVDRNVDGHLDRNVDGDLDVAVGHLQWCRLGVDRAQREHGGHT
jgi:hypothetical protein